MRSQFQKKKQQNLLENEVVQSKWSQRLKGKGSARPCITTYKITDIVFGDTFCVSPQKLYPKNGR